MYTNITITIIIIIIISNTIPPIAPAITGTAPEPVAVVVAVVGGGVVVETSDVIECVIDDESPIITDEVNEVSLVAVAVTVAIIMYYHKINLYLLFRVNISVYDVLVKAALEYEVNNVQLLYWPDCEIILVSVE